MTDKKKTARYKKELINCIDNMSFPAFPLVKDEEIRSKLYDTMAFVCSSLADIQRIIEEDIND